MIQLGRGKVMFVAKNVYKKYYKKDIVKDFSIVLKRGEIHGLIGENSAGKTTIMKCLVGIYGCDKGEVLCDEKPVYDNPKVKEKIAYIADVNEYYKNYTVEKMVELFEIFYESFSRTKFDTLNQDFQLNTKVSVGKLSKGQKMRFAFMLALSQSPDYLIMDEPTSGLDVAGKKLFFDHLIAEVENNQLGVLISSHHLEHLEKVCDQITILSHGEVLAQNSVEDVKSRYRAYEVKIKDVKELERTLDDLQKEHVVLSCENIGQIYRILIDTMLRSIEEIVQGEEVYIQEVPSSLEAIYLAITTSKNKEELL